MLATGNLTYAARSDTGRKRSKNEDRVICDPEYGIFAVIDGMGGHAGGEVAAEIAETVMRARLERQSGSPEQRLREAIALANNAIYHRSVTETELAGMACVLTVALVTNSEVMIGHVGDSRAYLMTGTGIRKLTRDHSPVGEREDSGELTEQDAMMHPRRNEVYRDVGSRERTPLEEDFIDIMRAPFHSSDALLLCTDGLSDQVEASEITAIVRKHARDPDAAVEALITQANRSEGKDNVSVVAVFGRDFAASGRPVTVSEPLPEQSGSGLASRSIYLVLGILLAVLAGAAWYFWSRPHPLYVDPGSSISSAIEQASPGDVVFVMPGVYSENVRLKDGVSLVARQPGTAVLRASGVAVTAEGVRSGRIEGLRIEGDSTLETGVRIVSSDLDVRNVSISGATMAAIQIEGDAAPVITGCMIAQNGGSGIVIRGPARPRIAQSMITGNGWAAPVKPGIEIHAGALPSIVGNRIWNNGAEPIWAPPLLDTRELERQNSFENSRRNVRPMIP